MQPSTHTEVGKTKTKHQNKKNQEKSEELARSEWERRSGVMNWSWVQPGSAVTTVGCGWLWRWAACNGGQQP